MGINSGNIGTTEVHCPKNSSRKGAEQEKSKKTSSIDTIRFQVTYIPYGRSTLERQQQKHPKRMQKKLSGPGGKAGPPHWPQPSWARAAGAGPCDAHRSRPDPATPAAAALTLLPPGPSPDRGPQSGRGTGRAGWEWKVEEVGTFVLLFANLRLPVGLDLMPKGSER